MYFKSGQLLGPFVVSISVIVFLTHRKRILLKCHSTRRPLDGAAAPVSHNIISYMMFVEETNPPKASSKNARTKQLSPRKVYLIKTDFICIDSYWIWASGHLLPALQTSVSSLALFLSAKSLQQHIRTVFFPFSLECLS